MIRAQDKPRILGLMARIGLAAGLMAIGSTSLFAADAASSAPSAASSGESLEEIVVTAEKINVDVMHAALSVTAINGDDLERAEIHNTVDLQFLVPGLSVTNTVLNTNFNIRGVGSDFTSPNIGQGVPVYRDGLVVPPNEGDEPFWDIANVQVLRGPQGTLVGVNSTGGAVFINSVDPTIGSNHGYMQASYGDYHHLGAQGAVDLPISDTLAARVGVYYEKRDSFSTVLIPVNLENAFGQPTYLTQPEPGDLNMTSVRGSLLWKPNDRFDVLVKATYFQNLTGYAAEKPIPIASTTLNGVTTICPAPGSNVGTSPATWSQVPAACGNASFAPANPYVVGYAAPDSYLYEYINRESLEANYQLTDAGMKLRFLTGRADNSPRPSNENTASFNDTGGGSNRVHEITTTFEVDLISAASDKFNWVIGGYDWYDPAWIHFLGTNLTGGPIGTCTGCAQPAGGIYVDVKSDKRSWALFGNASYQFDPQWKLEFGLRETWNHEVNPWLACTNTPIVGCINGDNDSLYFIAPNSTNPLGPEQIVGGFNNTGNETDSFLTWRTALNYNLTPTNYFYGLVATGEKAGGVQSGTTNFQPEKDLDFELGYKGTLLDGHASIQVNGFYTKFTNMQIADQDLLDNQGTTYNAGTTNIHGIEFTGMANVQNWRLNATASYSKSSFSIGDILNKDICGLDSQCNNSSGQCAAGQPNGGNNSVGQANCFNYQTGGLYVNGKFYPWLDNVNGIQLPFSPTFQASFAVAYDIMLANGDVLTPRLDYEYQGQQSGQIYDTPLDYLPQRTNVNAKLGYVHDKWNAEAYVTNLTDKAYPVAFDASNAEIFNPPRQFGVRVTRIW